MARQALPKSHAPLPRVLFIATSAGEGGIERYSVRLAVLLRARGVPVTYACRPGGFLEGQCAAHGIPTFAWEVRNSGDVTASRLLAKWLRTHPIDIVHVHSRRDYVPAVLGTAFVRPRPRLLLHAHLIRRLGEPARLAGRFFRWGAARVIAVSEAVRERLVQEHRFSREFVHHLPNGVDTRTFAAAESDHEEWQSRRDASRQAWGVPPGVCVIGMMGRLNAKGQEALLAVMPELLRSFPETWVVLVGPEGSAGDQGRLRDQAEAAGVEARVVLPGMTEDVPAAMAGFDIVAHLPSDESFGLALAEAMAAGLPTVATDIGGCREVVQDGVTGTLVPLDDADALVAALTSLLDPEAGPGRRARFGAAGRRRVLAEFSLDRQVERLHGLYQRLC